MIYSIPRSTSAKCRWSPPSFCPFCRARVRPGEKPAATLAARVSAQHADPPRRILLRPPERHPVGAPDVSRADPDRGQRRGIRGRQYPGDLPAPVSCQRDADGRLVGLVFDSASPLPAHVTNRWLVAVDSSDSALRAVAHAAGQGGAMTACVLHLVNVQPWLDAEVAEAELAQRAWLATARARALLDANSRPWRLHVAMGGAAEQIIALTGRLDCSGIVIGSRGLGVTESLLLGSVTYKLMHLSPYPGMVVP